MNEAVLNQYQKAPRTWIVTRFDSSNSFCNYCIKQHC